MVVVVVLVVVVVSILAMLSVLKSLVTNVFAWNCAIAEGYGTECYPVLDWLFHLLFSWSPPLKFKMNLLPPLLLPLLPLPPLPPPQCSGVERGGDCLLRVGGDRRLSRE